MIEELRICDHLSNPPAIPIRKLIRLTRDYYFMSSRSVDNPRSNYHRWYYILANECERRKLDLERIIGKPAESR